MQQERDIERAVDCSRLLNSNIIWETESDLFTDDTSKDNHSPGPVIREASP